MKEFKIEIPEGYEIDTENTDLTSGVVKFKQLPVKPWRDSEEQLIEGYLITTNSAIEHLEQMPNNDLNYNTFATYKQAKSALAMARISQIMANDKRFGGVVTDEEWADDCEIKFCIDRYNNKITKRVYFSYYLFLAFRTEEQRDLFLAENKDLVKDYLMID